MEIHGIAKSDDVVTMKLSFELTIDMLEYARQALKSVYRLDSSKSDSLTSHSDNLILVYLLCRLEEQEPGSIHRLATTAGDSNKQLWELLREEDDEDTDESPPTFDSWQ